MESGVSEEDIIKMGRKYLRDSIDAYMGGKIDSGELDKMYTDVMSKVPDNVMQRGEDEVKKMKKNG